MKAEHRELERRLTAEILERVRGVARLREEPEDEFHAGRTPVRYAGRVYGEQEMVNLVEASLEFWLTAGRWHNRLEEGLAKWYGVRHARLVNSGSSANLLAVAALMSPLLGDRRLRPGDEVLTVAAGFPTTVAPIIQLGLVPVFVDIALPTYNVDVEMLRSSVTPRTRAVMLAHTLGNPFDLGAVIRLCEKHDLFLVEDNCDAAGSLYDGKKTGTFGSLATLSFYPPHHMTTGEGGAVLTNDDTLARAVESLRDWGRDCWCASGVDNTCRKRFGWHLGQLPEGYDHKYIYSHVGFNLKMTDLQASVGVAQLGRLAGFCAARRSNWAFYHDELMDLEEFFVLPKATPGADPSWFGFLICVRDNAPFTRNDIVQFLESRRVQTRMLFAGNLLRQPGFQQVRAGHVTVGTEPAAGSQFPLPVTDRVMERAFWVGVYPGLTASARDYVTATTRAFVESVLGRRRMR